MRTVGILQGYKGRLFLWALVLVALLFAVLFTSAAPFSASAATTVPTKMNFQGRITNNAGNILADGTYNMKFRIWNQSSGGSQQWSEDRLVSATQGVAVTNGHFSVQLGSVTSLPASVFTSSTLYFEVELPTPATATSSSPSWTEGPMTPRNQLATTAYAYNADMIDGIDGADLAQLGGTNSFTGTNNFSGATNLGLTTVAATSATAFRVQTSGGSENLFTADTSAMSVTVNGGITQTGTKLTLKASMAGSTATSYPRGMVVVGNYVYLVNENGSGSTFSVIDVTDPAAPAVVGSITHANLTEGRELRVRGRYAYTVGINGILNVIDITNPSSPTILTSLTDTTNFSNAHGIELQGKYAYITGTGTTRISVVDISNPASPTVVGSVIDATNLSNPRQIEIYGKYAYVSSYNSDRFTVLNLSDPTSPTVAASITNAVLDGIRDISIDGKYAYVASDLADSIAIVNISNPTSPTIVGSLADSTNMNEAFNVTVNGNYAYVSGRDSNYVAVIDVSNKASPSLVSGAGYSGITKPVDTDLNGRYLYVLSNISSTGLSTFYVLDTNGTTLGSTTANSLDTISLNVEVSAEIGNKLHVGDTLSVGEGIAVGGGGVQTSGGLAATSGNITATSAPTQDIFTVSNSGQAVNTTGVDGLSVNYVGGNTASIEGSGIRVNYTPGSGSSSLWSGMRIVSGNSSASTTNYGLLIEGPGTGSGTDIGMRVASGFDIGVDIAEGGLQMAAAGSEPSSPAASNLKIYAADIAGRIMLKIKGPSGLDTALQPALFNNSISMLLPSNGTTVTTWGLQNTAVGTVSTPTIGNTDLASSIRRMRVTSAAPANAASELRSTQPLVWRGNASGLGGFFYAARVGVGSTTTNQRLFSGLTGSTGAISKSQDPMALTNAVGAAWGSGDANLSIVHNDGSGVATEIDLGANFPANNTAAVYEIILFAPPNGSTIGYRVIRLDTGQSTSGTLSSNLPLNTQPMTHHQYMNNGGTAAAVILDVARVYVESDY